MSKKIKLIYLIVTLFLLGGLIQPIFAFHPLKEIKGQKLLIQITQAQEDETKEGDRQEKPVTATDQPPRIRNDYERGVSTFKARFRNLFPTTPYTTITTPRKEEREQLKSFFGEKKREIDLKTAEKRRAVLEIAQRKRLSLQENQERIRTEAERLLKPDKVEIVERLSERINFINDKITDAYLRHLDSIDKVLTKIVSRLDKAEKSGSDVSELRLKVVAAMETMNLVREEVLAQKEKVYSVRIDSAETVGQAFSQARNDLREDHDRLKREVIRPALDIIKEIHQALKISTAK